MRETALMLKDYRLTLAEIVYHMPDRPCLLQTYVWQDYDLAPGFPVLCKFLDFWARNLDGKLHSVTVAAGSLIRPAEFRHAGVLLSVH